MKIIMDIPEYTYNYIKNCGYVYPEHAEDVAGYIVGSTPLEWIPMRRNNYPKDGQRIFVSTATGKIHDLIWNSKCIQNYARNGCWYKNWFVKAWMPFFIEPYKAESEEEGIRQVIKDATVIERSLCDSCINNGCIFQSGIVRSHCDFYKAESEE